MEKWNRTQYKGGMEPSIERSFVKNSRFTVLKYGLGTHEKETWNQGIERKFIESSRLAVWKSGIGTNSQQIFSKYQERASSRWMPLLKKEPEQNLKNISAQPKDAEVGNFFSPRYRGTINLGWVVASVNCPLSRFMTWLRNLISTTEKKKFEIRRWGTFSMRKSKFSTIKSWMDHGILHCTKKKNPRALIIGERIIFTCINSFHSEAPYIWNHYSRSRANQL